MNRAFVALLCASASGLAVLPARAEPSNATAKPAAAYVLSIWTDEVDDQADALTQALRARVRQGPSWSLLETTQSFETLAIALKCPAKPDPPCLQRIGDHLKADHYVWGTMQRRPGAAEVTTEVHLWSRGQPDVAARETYGDGLKDPSGTPLRAVAANLWATLTGAPISAPKSVTPPLGGEEGTTLPRASSPPSDAAPEPTESRVALRAVLGYSALVLAGGFLVASGIEAANWVADRDASSQDRKNVPNSVTDVCATPVNAAAQDACNKNKDAADVSTLGWVFAGVGAALVGTGIFLIVTGGPSLEGSREASAHPRLIRHIELRPSVGTRAGQLSLRATF